MMVLVDSLDVGCEGARRSGSIAELLGAHQNLMPGWILLVCSVRCHNKTVRRMFSGGCGARSKTMMCGPPALDSEKDVS